MNRAIENSIKDAGMDYVTYEPLNPESLKRKSGIPVGLKNIGNTCYFNSLIQTYFMVPKLVEEILTFTCHPSHLIEPIQNDADKGEYLRKKASITLVEELQKLFSFLTFSNRKYIDPGKVLGALVDDFGNQIRVGEQKDVGEFHLILVARIEEGLRTKNELVEISEDKEDSSLKRKESVNFIGQKLDEHGIVPQIFFGKQKEYLKIEGIQAPIVNEVVFGQIILDVEEKDLYSAWDASYHCEVDGYLVENIGKTRAVQEIWPKNFPGVLLFQIQRVKYDLSVNNTVKINKRFSFPQEIFTDRFLGDNSQESLGIRAQMLELKTKAREIEKKIERFASYGGENMSLETIIENSLLFLQGQQNSVAMEVDGVHDPKNLLLEGMDLSTSQEVLRALKEKVATRVKVLNEELATIYDKIQNLYDISQMKIHSYQLHSLLVHDGYAGSGHYYSFVHDIESNSWRKYSDLAISDVTFEEVYNDAVGGNGLASAYCLFYVSTDLLQRKPSPFWNFNLDTMQNTHYYSLIPEKIVVEITDDNLKLEEEIKSFQSSAIFSKVSNLYESRLGEIEKIHKENNNSGENIRFALINFPFYLKCSNRDIDLHRRFLLHQAYREVMQCELNDLKWSDPIYPKMQAVYQNKLTLTENDRENIQKESEIYSEICSLAEVFCDVVTMMLEDRLIDAFKVIIFNSEINSFRLDDFSKCIKDYSCVLTLRCTSEIYRKFYSGAYSDILTFVSIVGHLIVHVLDNGDIIGKICLQRLEEIYKDLNKKGGGFSEISLQYQEIVKVIKDREVLAQVDFSEMPDECGFIKVKKEILDPFVWAVGIQQEDIAVRYIKTKVKLNDQKLRQWYLLYENFKRVRSYNEKGFKDAENLTLDLVRN